MIGAADLFRVEKIEAAFFPATDNQIPVFIVKRDWRDASQVQILAIEPIPIRRSIVVLQL